MRYQSLFFLLIIPFFALSSDENKTEKSIKTFCSNEAKPESMAVCESYLKMMVTFSHHVGYAAAACEQGPTKEVDCREIEATDKEINALQGK